MEIKAVKFRDDGFYTQPFVLGGEEGVDKYDKNIRYKGSMPVEENSPRILIRWVEKELLNLLTGRYRSTADDTNF